MSDRRAGAIGLAIVAAHLAGGIALTPGYLEPDSVAVFAWIRSLVFNGDFLFFDEWTGFGLIRDGIPLFKEVSAAGALANHWWIGASILSAPAYVLAHLVATGAAIRNGFGGVYGHALAWAAVSFGALASLLGWRIALRENIAPRFALGALAAVWVGTPMFWYEYRHPLGTHLAGLLCIAVVAMLLRRAEDEGDGWIDVLIGLWLGLAIVTRLQHVLLIPAVALHLWRVRRPLRSWVAVALAGTLPLLAQGFAWSAVYGQPLGPLAAGSSPLGGTWMVMRTIALDEVLFSTYHGLLPWAPVAAFGIAGWFLEVRRRVLAGTFLAMFAGEWLANGLLDRYFWGGLSFGPRRFVDLAIPLAIGVAWLLRRSGAIGAVAVAAASAWTVLLTVAAAAGTLDLSRDVSFAEMVAAIRSVPWSRTAAILFGGTALARAPALAVVGAAIAAAAGA
ncbi:MAG: hypothetical protein ACRD2J_16375, partial [Thermoanaerobaculia bacterium]